MPKSLPELIEQAKQIMQQEATTDKAGRILLLDFNEQYKPKLAAFEKEFSEWAGGNQEIDALLRKETPEALRACQVALGEVKRVLPLSHQLAAFEQSRPTVARSSAENCLRYKLNETTEWPADDLVAAVSLGDVAAAKMIRAAIKAYCAELNADKSLNEEQKSALLVTLKESPLVTTHRSQSPRGKTNRENLIDAEIKKLQTAKDQVQLVAKEKSEARWMKTIKRAESGAGSLERKIQQLQTLRVSAVAARRGDRDPKMKIIIAARGSPSQKVIDAIDKRIEQLTAQQQQKKSEEEKPKKRKHPKQKQKKKHRQEEKKKEAPAEEKKEALKAEIPPTARRPGRHTRIVRPQKKAKASKWVAKAREIAANTELSVSKKQEDIAALYEGALRTHYKPSPKGAKLLVVMDQAPNLKELKVIGEIFNRVHDSERQWCQIVSEIESSSGSTDEKIKKLEGYREKVDTVFGLLKDKKGVPASVQEHGEPSLRVYDKIDEAINRLTQSQSRHGPPTR